MKAWLTLLFCGVAASAAGADTLTIGYQKGGGLLSLLKVQGTLEKNLAPHGYQVRWIEFPAGPQMLEALNAGSIDVGSTGAPPPIFAQAGGVDLLYIGAEPGTVHGEAVLVLASSTLRGVAQLKGKKVAFQKGSGSHFLLVAALQKAGLAISDIQPVYLSPADARAAFVSGSIDAWVVWDPYLAAAQDTLKARVLADYTGLRQPNNFYEASRGFVSRAPAVVTTLLQTLASTGAWANQHPDQVATLIAAQTGVPLAVAETWQRRSHAGTVPVSPAIAAAQQQVADLFYDLKLIPKKVDVGSRVWRWQQ